MKAQRVNNLSIKTLGGAKGAYLFVLQLGHSYQIKLTRKAPVTLTAGWYFYAGSAMGPGGLQARLKRHFKRDKKVHWHIDQLTKHAIRRFAYAVEDSCECDLVRILKKSGEYESALCGFGNSDCRTCDSHLLRATNNRLSGLQQLLEENLKVG